MTRVLVVDDSPTVRGLLGALLDEAGLSVVGEARDGLEALEQVRALEPDVITMDLHMPRLDGIGATARIMTERPTPIVVVTASAGAREGDRVMRALDAGALTVVSTPDPGGPDFEPSCARLIGAVRAMTGMRTVRRRGALACRPGPAPPLPEPAAGPRLVAIAGSTGAPSVLRAILSALAPDAAAPVAVVQHMEGSFLEGFRAWLAERCPLPVRLVEGPAPLTPGVWLAPAHRHLAVASPGSLTLLDAPPVRGHRPAAEVLFASAARSFGPGLLTVVLSGMGDDGVQALGDVRARGGRVLIQDEQSAAVFGMPGAARQAGLVDLEGTAEELAGQVRRWLGGRSS